MNLHYKTYGTGTPLIILHGLFGSLDNWATLSKAFGKHCKVFALDQRNHGRSPHSNTFNYEVMASDLDAFMQQHGIHSACVLGHSMGGKTAMQFALTYQEKTDKLIVVDVAPKTYDRRHDEILDALSSLDLSLYSARRKVDEALATMIPDVAVRQFLLKNLRRSESGAFTWKINLGIIKKHYSEIADRPPAAGRVFMQPTLFIKGERSSYIGEHDHRIIMGLFPRATIVTVEGAGHWVHADAPQQLTRIVLDFLGASQ